MPNELQTAAGASLGGFLRQRPRPHARPSGSPCANCATPLQGPWCHACGQSAEDFHRSILRLAAEVMEGLVHVDGRLWRTLPDLMVRPARLTRSYLEGHRAPQIPPLRLFLVVLLAIFLIGGLTGRSVRGAAVTPSSHGVSVVQLEKLTPAERAKIGAGIDQATIHLGSDKSDVAATAWLRDRVKRTIADPERFKLILEQWSERFAFLMLPVSAVLLSVLFIFQRRFYLFDHTIFSLHSLSAMGLALTLAMALSPLVGGAAYLLLFPAPVHLFVHMRGVYRTRVVGTLARMFLLFLGTVVAAVILMTGLLAVGLNGMGV